ncbi:MAG: hypothetical protein Q4E16_01370 [Neisseria sp.]|nr:hypothetical protein [Neisseria sp.]
MPSAEKVQTAFCLPNGLLNTRIAYNQVCTIHNQAFFQIWHAFA